MHFIQHSSSENSFSETKMPISILFYGFSSAQLSNLGHETIQVNSKFWENFPKIFEFSTGLIENNLCKKVVFGVNCWKYFLIALITFRSSSDKFVSGHFALYKLIAETLTFRASNLFLEVPFFHDCSWTYHSSWKQISNSLLTILACSPGWPNIACKMRDNDFQPECQSGP